MVRTTPPQVSRKQEGRKIITDFWKKPIPDRNWDWTATWDNYSGLGSPIGAGSTEKEAIDELRRKTEERE